MLRLVENVLDFSAIQAGRVRLQLQETDLEEVVETVLETARIIADAKDIEIRCRMDGSHPRLSLDRIKIAQAVQNLVSNAVQYSPAGSVIEVRLGSGERTVTIEVEDHGAGIPETELPGLF
jgi:signal transduction histidine kinase